MKPSALNSQWERSTTRRFLRWLTRWRTVRWFLLGGAALVTLVALFYAVEAWRGQRAWNRFVQEVPGEPLAMTAVIPPPVPDDQNLAMAPLFRPILDYEQGPGGIEWRDTNGLERLRAIDVDQRPDGVGRPDLGQLDEGTLADFQAWAEFYRGNPHYPQAPEGASPAEVVLTALGKFDEELQMLRSAAAERPASRFPVQYDTEPPVAIMLPHLAVLRAIGRLLHVHGLAELERQQPEAAAADFELGLRLSDALRDEPILISHLVRAALLRSQLQLLREGLARQAWPDEFLARFERRLAGMNLLAEHQLAFRGERAFTLGTLDYERRQGWGDTRGLFFSDDDVPPGVRMAFNIWPGGWTDQNKATIGRLLQECSLAAVDPEAKRVHPEVAVAGGERIEQLKTGPYTVFAKLFLPAVTRATVRSARTQVSVDLARVACALERYRLAQGKLPSTLDALAPEFLERVPPDIIDGRPLRYRITGPNQYLLYSVGWNEVDDSGQRGWTDADEKRVDLEEGDWVW